MYRWIGIIFWRRVFLRLSRLSDLFAVSWTLWSLRPLLSHPGSSSSFWQFSSLWSSRSLSGACQLRWSSFSVFLLWMTTLKESHIVLGQRQQIPSYSIVTLTADPRRGDHRWVCLPWVWILSLGQKPLKSVCPLTSSEKDGHRGLMEHQILGGSLRTWRMERTCGDWSHSLGASHSCCWEWTKAACWCRHHWHPPGKMTLIQVIVSPCLYPYLLRSSLPSPLWSP